MSRFLTLHQFDSARAFLLDKARPVERALFRCIFESGPIGDVTQAMSEFQNEDGGYGHGLEADLRTPLSSVLCTNFAMDYWRMIGAEPSLVRSALAFLVGEFDKNLRFWRFLPDGAQQWPHAPWWSVERQNDERDRVGVNPKFETLSHLFAYRELVADFPVDEILDESLAMLPTKHEGLSKNDIECCVKLVEAEGISLLHRDMLLERLNDWIPKLIERNPNKWAEYCLQPLDVVTSKESPFFNLFEDDVETALEYRISHQTPVGSWEPNWNWYGSFPHEWERAKLEWTGAITLKTLCLLQSFGD
jgi:hypothetical protein